MNNKLVISLLIILVSAIYGLPNIILFNKLGQNYNPLVISGDSRIARDEAFAYAPEVNYILKGHFFLKDAYVAEYSNYPTPFMGESAPSLVFALLAKLTGSVENAFIAADFIFPPIIFVLLYIITNIFIKNKLYSAAVAFLTVIARDFIAVIPYPHATFQYLTFTEGQNYLLYFSRAFHPQLTFILFIAAVLLMIKLLKNPTNKLATLTLGLIFGILFYTYVFYWTYFLLTFLCVLTYSCIKKDLKTTGALILSGAIAFIIASFYIYNSWQFSQLNFADDFITKTSLHNLPLPLTLLRYLAITLFFLAIVKLKNHQSVILFLVLLSGVVISPLSRLVIGQDLETFHYLRRALMPIATIASFIITYYFIRQKKKLLSIISMIIFSTALFLGLRTQIIATEKIQTAHQRDRTQEAVFNWLRQNTPKDSVVGSLDTTFNSLVPVYTKNYVYFPPTDRTIMPTSEGVQRYAILANTLGIDTNWQKKNLDDIISYLFVYQAYNDQNNLDLNSPKRLQAEAQIDKIARNNIENEIEKFKLDYVVVTPEHLPIVRPNLKFAKPLTSIDEFVIFQIDYK